MAIKKIWKVFIPFLTLVAILGTSAAIIAYGRGYRIGVRDNQLIKPTGLVSATSDPIGAQVFVEGELKTATNNTFNIDPNWYSVKISKEGYIPWEKKLRVQGEVVSRADAFLFPTNPSLSPLTTSGIEHPVVSPDGTKIAYSVPTTGTDAVALKTGGLWVYDLADRPLGLNRDPRQIAKPDTIFDLTNAQLTWSPDSTQIMVNDGKNARLYQLSRPNEFQSITITFDVLLRQWDEEKRTREEQQLSGLKQPFIDFATSSAKILSFSPDENKILYEATRSATLPQVIVPALIGTNPTEEQRTVKPGYLYVYDSREDKNYFFMEKKEIPALLAVDTTPTPTPRNARATNRALPTVKQPAFPIRWFPTSRHLVIALDGKIDILEYDRTNWVTVYAGPFIDGFMMPYPNGSRIIILTNLNSGVAKYPNLYTVNLR